MHSIIFEAARVSELAYYDSPDAFLKEGYTDVCHIVNENSSTEVFVLEDTSYIYVVFPGTENDEGLDDIKTNVRFLNKTQFHNMKIHRGFWEAWRDVSSDVAEEVLLRVLDDGTGKQPKPVIYCGHSLGGAIAVIGAAAHNPQFCITFGQPHVGGKNFVKHMASMEVKYVRVVNNADPVPGLLFWNPNYRHGGDLIYFDDDGHPHMRPNTLKRIALRGLDQVDFSDHSMNEYLINCYLNTGGDKE